MGRSRTGTGQYKNQESNSLGKSTIDGDNGRNDPGDINPGNMLRNAFSNLHIVFVSQPLS